MGNLADWIVVGGGIKHRLVIAFSVLILLFVLMAGIGLWQLGELQRAAAPQAGFAAAADDARSMLVGLAAAGFALAIGYAWCVTTTVTRPLRRASAVAESVADGDLTEQLDARELAATGHLLQAIDRMMRSLRALIGEVAAGARTVTDTSAQIAHGNVDLSQRTEEQASTLEQTAASMEELTSTVAQNAQHAQQADQLARDASDVARRGSDVVDQLLATMDQISDASKRIADIIGVIDGIAFQTNILALNAAVEAARAGEQGRGFAVVATEVRSLAQRSGAAAKEIKALIGDAAQKVQAGSGLADSAGHTMVEVVAATGKVGELIAQIASASREQADGIAQVNTALTQMDQVVQQNASLVEEATAATESLKDEAGRLLQAVSRFKLPGGADAGQPPPEVLTLALPRKLQPAAPGARLPMSATR